MKKAIFLCQAICLQQVFGFVQVSTNLRNDMRQTTSSPKDTTLHVPTQLYESKEKPSGVYSRPSAAIEKGSGFYVPGLEGSRVRILFGILVLALSYVNTLLGLGDSNLQAVEFSQKLTVFYGALLLFQGLVESAKEAGLGVDFDSMEIDPNAKSNKSVKMDSSSVTKNLSQYANSLLGKNDVDQFRWAAASFVALTPATHFLVLEEKDGSFQVMYSLGDALKESDSSAIEAAISTVYNSKGGRVAVPETHPSAALLPEEHKRCILLQKIDMEANDGKRRCIMVASNQLLAAFTKNDLNWLGCLGAYVGDS